MRRIEADANGITLVFREDPAFRELDPNRKVAVVAVTDIKANLRNRTNTDTTKLEALRAHLQAQVDERIPLADFPDEDPDKTVDPGLEGWFHDGTDMVSRRIVVDAVEWQENRNRFRPTVRVSGADL